MTEPAAHKGPAAPIPDVTVVIPTHQRRELVQRAIGSVLAQREVAVDVVVVVEASTDGTAETLRAITDPRVRMIYHPVARGVSAARNAGLAHTQTPWVAFLDDDDFFAPSRLADGLAAAASVPGALWSCGGAIVVGAGMRALMFQHPPQPRRVNEQAFLRNPIPGGGSGVLARTDLVREVGAFDVGLSMLADWDLWIRLSLRSPVGVVPDAVIAYLNHEGNMTDRSLHQAELELDLLLERYAAEIYASGTTFDWAHWNRWMAGGYRARGNLLRSALYRARLIRVTRSPVDACRAVGHLVLPGPLYHRLRRRGLLVREPDPVGERWDLRVKDGHSSRTAHSRPSRTARYPGLTRRPRPERGATRAAAAVVPSPGRGAGVRNGDVGRRGNRRPVGAVRGSPPDVCLSRLTSAAAVATTPRPGAGIVPQGELTRRFDRSDG